MAHDQTRKILGLEGVQRAHHQDRAVMHVSEMVLEKARAIVRMPRGMDGLMPPRQKRVS